MVPLGIMLVLLGIAGLIATQLILRRIIKKYMKGEGQDEMY